ncbi:peroxidase family protein [Streptomyces sp. NPDC050504]|uniref:peroxidase family protein n=1 Tax=Streptomyces sp. NPDC050504 TaxID=3365618 RepID=UPI0037AE2AB6
MERSNPEINRRAVLLSGAVAAATVATAATAGAASAAAEPEAGAAGTAGGTAAPNPPVYRSVTGYGNNLKHPERGAAGSVFLRRARVGYADGVSAPAGADRPSARVVSNIVCRQETDTLNAQRLTDLTWMWGQFLNHDFNLIPAADPLETIGIPVPADDTAFPPGSQIPLTRSAYDPSTGTGRRNPRQQINNFTTYIDGNSVYGPDEGRAAALRAIRNLGPVAAYGSALKTGAGVDGPVLPLNTAGLFNQTVGPAAGYFLAGDERANTGYGLMSIHSLFVREHNRLAALIAAERPTASAEQVFQHARKWVGALIGTITFQEFIPAILGPNAIGPYTGYDPHVDPTMSAEFATFGFRFGHSMLSPDLLIVDNDGQLLQAVPHGQALLNIGIVNRYGIGPVFKGFASQIMQEVDVSVIEAMRSIRLPGAPPLDLVAVDIQRARDHGVPDYNQCRRAYGLPPRRTFAELTPNPAVQAKLSAAYGDIRLLDPLIGGLAEPHIPGTAFGPLFTAVITEQLTRTRAGDRLWFENDPALTPAEVAAIKSTRMSDVIKRNTQITNIQEDVFHLPL